MTLGEALPAEMARVRDEVLPEYLKLRGMPGVMPEFAIRGMQADLDAAARAMAEGDAVAMLRCLDALRGWSL